MEIQHFSHPEHTLNLVASIKESKVPNCNCCDEVMSFPGYACQSFKYRDCDLNGKNRISVPVGKCKFYLHKSCAELAEKTSHPLHPHPLILLSEIPGFHGIICDGCRNLYNKGFTYDCSWLCGFNLHPKCASKQDHEELLQQQTFNKELTLDHICHKHALKLCNLRQSDEKYCCCCKQSISGSAYCCLQCQFFIHESCTEIPVEVQCPFHPQHPLLAQAMEKYKSTICVACKSEINGVRISCNKCKFHLHVSCANPNRCALKRKCYKHNMYYFVQDDTMGSHRCNNCHERCFHESFYRCVECDFNLHLKCIPIPSVVTVTQKHQHPLTLIDSVKEDNPIIQYLIDSNNEVNYFMDYYCDVCETPGNPKHHAYCCKECIYIAHVECIISMDDNPPEMSDEADFDPAESDRCTEQAAQSMSKKKNGAASLDSKCKDNEEHFRYPSHRHKLALLLLDPNNKKIKYCNGCNEEICFPCYACENAKCKFYLHKSCAELLPKILHPPLQEKLYFVTRGMILVSKYFLQLLMVIFGLWKKPRVQ